MEVEEITPANQNAAAELILDGLAEHWGDQTAGGFDPDLNRDLVDMIASYGHGRTILVRGENGELLGTGTIVPVDDSTAEIVRMSVAVQARRLGVGRRIVSELVDTARQWDLRRVILETTSAWVDVVSFYRNCGFAVTHTRDSEFGEETWFEYRL